MSWRRLPDPPGVVADPLLAALACHLNLLWVRAPDERGARIYTHRDTAHSPINARAVVLAAGLEGISVPVPDAIEDTTHP